LSLDYFKWAIGGSEQMRLTSTGLGIGTSSPGAKLDVQTANSRFRISDDGTSQFFDTLNTAASAWYPFVHRATQWTWNNGSADRLKLDTSGNLGLGVTPSAWIDDKAIQLPQGSISSGYEYGIATTANAYRSASNIWKYTSGQAAFKANINNVGFQWFTSGTGTAGNAITFTQAMTLDASGNLGIGATSISAVGSQTVLAVGAASGGTVAHYQSGSVVYRTSASTSGVDCYNPNSTPITWYTSGTSRMTLDASGNLLLGTTSNAYGNKLRVARTDASDGVIETAVTVTSNAYQIRFVNGNGLVGSITTNASVTSFNIASDLRLKENIQDAADAASLIDTLQVRQFDWKTDGSHQRYGFIAQELVIVAPEAVHQPADPEEMMAVDYSKLVPMLVKEIQSLRKRLAAAGI
jgi:hypothetical protein